MAREGVDDYDSFHVWLEEERDYLLGLENGLPKKREETLEMEYVKKLMNLRTSQYVFACLRSSSLLNALLFQGQIKINLGIRTGSTL